MQLHEDIAEMAAKEFADHRLKKGPGLSWRMWDPKKGGAYSFRVIWTPGHLIVTGDIGSADYCVWPSFGTLWGAIELTHRAGYDYLTGKSGAAQVYDEAETIRDVIQCADEQMKEWGDFSIWKKIFHHYALSENHRSAAQQMKIAGRMRDEGLPEHLAWEIYESSVRSYNAQTRWCYEALQLWCRAILAHEPLWHRTWRWSQKKWTRIKRLPKDWRELHRRPELYEHDPQGQNRHFKGHVYAKVLRRPKNAASYCFAAEVQPFVLFGRLIPGWWQETGSGGRLKDMVQITPQVAMERVCARAKREWVRPALKAALGAAAHG